MTSPTIVWFRQDLRLGDNPALSAAIARGGPVIPVYILDEDGIPPAVRPGGASRWWLHQSLHALDADLRRRGAGLVLRRGGTGAVLRSLVAQTGAGAVFWNRCYEPHARERDAALKASMAAAGLEVASHNAALLIEPWVLKGSSGGPYRVFSAYMRAMMARGDPPPPLPAPGAMAVPSVLPDSDALDSWGLLPRHPDWAGGLRAAWSPGEAGAAARLASFLDEALHDYKSSRDVPGIDGTSRLSPHLHWGEIGPRQVWAATRARATGAQTEAFLRELVWREFSYHLLYHFPTLPEQPLDARFQAFPVRDDPVAQAAWTRGRTGYPIVDAGMRQVWETGWMHNRVRMIVGSFLVKHLLLPWQTGEAWFWDVLVDADLANNAASWQWIAGCGADAAPFFRIFNPVLQGTRFDPQGRYIRRFVPELARLPDRFIHTPWEAPRELLAVAGVTLGETYPAPLVDHAWARQRALDAFRQTRE